MSRPCTGRSRRSGVASTRMSRSMYRSRVHVPVAVRVLCLCGVRGRDVGDAGASLVFCAHDSGGAGDVEPAARRTSRDAERSGVGHRCRPCGVLALPVGVATRLPTTRTTAYGAAHPRALRTPHGAGGERPCVADGRDDRQQCNVAASGSAGCGVGGLGVRLRLVRVAVVRDYPLGVSTSAST